MTGPSDTPRAPRAAISDAGPADEEPFDDTAFEEARERDIADDARAFQRCCKARSRFVSLEVSRRQVKALRARSGEALPVRVGAALRGDPAGVADRWMLVIDAAADTYCRADIRSATIAQNKAEKYRTIDLVVRQHLAKAGVKRYDDVPRGRKKGFVPAVVADLASRGIDRSERTVRRAIGELGL